MNWYTVYLRETSEVVAAGTSEMCTRKLGYSSENSFLSQMSRYRKEPDKHRKYECMVEPMTPEEVERFHAHKRKALR